MTKNNIKKIISSLFAIVIPCILFGAENTAATSAKSSLDINAILTIVAIILLLPLYISSKTFLLVAVDYAKKRKERATNINKMAALALFLMISQQAFSQAIEVAAGPKSGNLFSTSTTTWILVIVIVLLSVLIIFFSFLTNSFIKNQVDEAKPANAKSNNSATETSEESWLKKIWFKMNKFKSLKEEVDIDTGHSYDGIRELDNIAPPWFVFGFIGSIIIAAAYLINYHVLKSSPLQIEEYNIELAEAAKEDAARLAIQGNKVDENSVTFLSGNDIEIGKKVFATKNCASCHGATGGSAPGGVGPNLVDAYWIHGGSIKDIFKSIKYGWPEKGMISWKDQLSAKEMAQVSSYILSLKGTTPAGAKEPQGDLYKDESISNNSDSTINDSIAPKN
ncbi:MAG: cbb3-type cytochrome c oxidase N-terminal domain-containing protein [bacterium]|nr:cbb3-type cytochrome c oxidase N-terminal domain-containing protein [bacterium]